MPEPHVDKWLCTVKLIFVAFRCHAAVSRSLDEINIYSFLSVQYVPVFYFSVRNKKPHNAGRNGVQKDSFPGWHVKDKQGADDEICNKTWLSNDKISLRIRAAKLKFLPGALRIYWPWIIQRQISHYWNFSVLFIRRLTARTRHSGILTVPTRP